MNSIISKAHEYRDQYERLKARHHGTIEQGKTIVRTAVRTAEVGAAALAFGAIQGRYGAVRVVGIPVDLLFGLGGHVAGFMGLAEDVAPHLHAFSDGALASHFTAVGRGMGKEWRAKAGKPPLIEAVSGVGAEARPELTGGGALSDEELARLARRA